MAPKHPTGRDVPRPGRRRFAADLAGARPPDLELKGVRLPAMDGFDVATTPRRMCPAIAAIVLVLQDGARQKAHLVGVAAFASRRGGDTCSPVPSPASSPPSPTTPQGHATVHVQVPDVEANLATTVEPGRPATGPGADAPPRPGLVSTAERRTPAAVIVGGRREGPGGTSCSQRLTPSPGRGRRHRGVDGAVGRDFHRRPRPSRKDRCRARSTRSIRRAVGVTMRGSTPGSPLPAASRTRGGRGGAGRDRT